MNFRRTLLIPFFLLTLLFQISAQDLSDNLVAYWPFDGDLTDYTGVNNGTISGSETYATGQFGQAIDLNGTSYVNAGMDNSLFMFNKSFTISIWFTVDGDWEDPWETLIAKGENANFRLSRASSNDLAMNWRAGSNNNLFISQGGGLSFEGGDIYHMVVTKVANGPKSVYVNGALLTSDADNTSIDSNNDTDLWIGGNPQAAGREWDGLVDDVGIWDRILTEDEIEQIYESGMSLGELLDPRQIPTLGEWGLIILGLSMFTLALMFIRRRKIVLNH